MKSYYNDPKVTSNNVIPVDDITDKFADVLIGKWLHLHSIDMLHFVVDDYLCLWSAAATMNVPTLKKGHHQAQSSHNQPKVSQSVTTLKTAFTNITISGR